jgi:hypothetical protein
MIGLRHDTSGKQRVMPEHSQPVELFFSYSHRDLQLREELERHLTLLMRQSVISSWHDRQIGAGSEWAGEIDAHLNSAHIILLLVSADFLSSDYCYDIEMKRALARHAAGEARVIPVLLRAVEWQGALFSHLQAVPTGGLPVTSWDNRDEAFADVTRAIRRAASDLTLSRSRSPVPTGSASALPGRSAQYFPEQRQLIEEHARGVIGREYVEEALDRFMATHSGGYFIIEAGPGQGKTAIAARLVVQRRSVHHFIGRTGRRSDLRQVLSSLIAQLDETAEPERAMSKSLDELAAWYEDALRARSAASPPLLVVFDALNELVADEELDLPFLPADSLPPRAFIVVTSQPGDRLSRLREQLATVPTLVYQLGPLHTDEVHAVIRSRQPQAGDLLIERVSHASLGSPLYLRAALDAMDLGSDIETASLPEAAEGYFRRATRRLADKPLLREVLGLLAVSRKSLSLLELSQITGSSQRSVHTDAIKSIRPFLLEIDDGYIFYHERFHDFVVRELLYDDELRGYHAQIARWLQSPLGTSRDYYWTSLAYHLFRAGDTRGLLDHVDAQFLARKLRRFGYGVLEDLELLAGALLAAGDTSFVEQCVARLDGLMDIVGSNMVDELARSTQQNLPRAASAHSESIVLRTTGVAGIDAHAVLLPKRQVTADFVEIVRRNGRLVVAIGDAPMSGLKSAFVARFIATLFRSLVLAPGRFHLGQVLDQLSAVVSKHSYFERVSMQCVEVALDAGTIAFASAGHPYPVLYSARYRGCDRLTVQGALLHGVQVDHIEPRPYEVRHAEAEAGQIVVLVSDGITEGGAVEDPYGYRFMPVIERHAGDSARTICEAIVADWRAYLAGALPTDDATIVVLSLTDNASRKQHDAT